MASTIHLFARSLYSDVPPDRQTKAAVNPTLLVSWWATGFAIVTILIRVMGRFVRTERLFLEDKIMFYSIIPLLIRMGLVHVVLIWGTNNAVTTGLDAIDIHHREIGSKLVLAARVFYAAFIWIAKYSLIAFLKRIIGTSWHKSYEIGMRVIDAFLALTFIAVVIATLAECHPVSHYWQVVPDPGPQCREALAQLIVMGVCDILTDLVLIVFPIPLVVMSAMPLKRKISLVLLFLMSLVLIAVTAYRVPTTISRHAAQQYRSLLASLEILAAAAVSNAIVIGSFIRDRGVKKAKFRAQSISEPDGPMQPLSRTKSIAQNHWGSDEDLVREFGISLDPSLRHRTNLEAPRLAPVAMPNSNAPASALFEDEDSHEPPVSHSNWNFNTGTRRRRHRRPSNSSASSLSSLSSEDIKLHDLEARAGTRRRKSSKKARAGADEDGESATPPKMSFFDVGGLIDDNISPIQTHAQNGTLVAQNTSPEIQTHQPRRASRAFLSDIGGLLVPSSANRGPSRSPHRRTPVATPQSSSYHLAPAPATLQAPVPGEVHRGSEGSPLPRRRDAEDEDEEDEEDPDELEEERMHRRMARRRRRDPRRLLGEMDGDAVGNEGAPTRTDTVREVRQDAGQAGRAGRSEQPSGRDSGRASVPATAATAAEGRRGGGGGGGFDTMSFGDAGGLLR